MTRTNTKQHKQMKNINQRTMSDTKFIVEKYHQYFRFTKVSVWFFFVDMTFIWSVVVWIFHEFHIFLKQTPVLTYATVILRWKLWRMGLMWNACKEICSREYFMQQWHGIPKMNTEKWNLFELERFFAISDDWYKRVRSFKIINRERLHSTIMINL